KLTITGWCRVRGLILYAERVKKELYKDMVWARITPQAPVLPAPPPNPGQTIVVSPGLAQQVVDSSAPTVPIGGSVAVSLGIGAFLNQGVDPRVCPPFGDQGQCDDILLTAANAGTATAPLA